MKDYPRVIFISILLSGCASTSVKNEHSDLPMTQNVEQIGLLSQLNRFPPRYPMQAAIKAIEGCATVEYIVTPQNKVQDIKVIAATNKLFAQPAAEVVENWKWSALPAGTITQAVKLQTRFDFCFDKPNQPCSTIAPQYSCPGEDIIYSSGMRVKSRG